MAEQTDDQLAAAERIRRDLDGGDPASSDIAALLAEVDRLRAELAETRAAGDALAFAVAPIERLGRGAPGSRLDVLITRAEEWRSVRGDAPTESVPWTDLERAVSTVQRVMPSDATTVICGVDVEETAREKLPDGSFRVTTRRRGDAPTEPAAAPQPAPFSQGDPVLVRGVVERVDDDGVVQVMLPGFKDGQPGFLTYFNGANLRPVSADDQSSAAGLPVTLSSVDDGPHPGDVRPGPCPECGDRGALQRWRTAETDEATCGACGCEYWVTTVDGDE